MQTDTLSRPQTERAKINKTIAYYASFIGLGLTTSTLGPTLPGLSAHTKATLSQASYLFAAHSLGYMLGTLFGGRMYDRFPGHRLQGVALLMMAVLMALVPVLPLLWVLAGVLLVLGVFEGSLDVGGNTLIVWVHREKNGPFMNGLHFFFGVGAFLAPVIVAQSLLLTQDIHWAYWAIALLLLPVSVWLLAQPSPEIRRGAQAASATQANTVLLVSIILFFFLYVGAEIGFAGWITTYSVALGLSDTVGGAYLTSVFWGALTLGRLLSIPIAARVSLRWILLGDTLGSVLSLGIILLFPRSVSAMWVGAFGTGLFMASVFPTTLSWAETRFPINGKITGLFFLGGSAGSMFFPWLVGQLFEPFGPRSVMLLVFAIMAADLLVYLTLMLPSSRKKGHAE
jgi:fucose permease